MVLCLFVYFLAVNFDWSIILIRKSFGASRHISGKLGVKLAIARRKSVWQELTIQVGMASVIAICYVGHNFSRNRGTQLGQS